MSTPARIGGFVAVLAVLFGAAFGIGRLFDDEPHHYRMVAGVEPSSDGTQLISVSLFDRGDVVLDLRTRHEKKLHLIAVRSDFGGYQHLHPIGQDSGAWVVDGALTNGRWRLYADFQPVGGSPTVVHDDVQVGRSGAAAPRAPVSRDVRVDGFRVQLTGDLVAGRESSMALRVTRDGRWVEPDPYLGAQGHLVVIRESDLSYQHAHPLMKALMAPEPPVIFRVSARAPGRYHLYFDFKVGFEVHTAHFVLDAAEGRGTDDMGGMDHGDH